MKKLLTFLILLLPLCLMAQTPPVLRQALTTNTAPVNPTNPGQIPIWTGTAWQFGTNLSGLVVTQLVSGDLLWTNISEVLNPTVFSRPVNASNFWVNSSPALAPNDSGVNLVVGHTDWRALHFQILNNHELRFTNINATRARLLPDTDLEIELGNTDMRFDGVYTAVIDSRTASDLDLFSDQSIFLNIGSAAYRFTSTSARPSPTLTLDLGIASAQWNGVYASNYTAGGGITNNGTYQHSVGAFTGALFVSSNANGVAYWSTNIPMLNVTNFSFGGTAITNIDQNWTNDTVVLRTSQTNTSPPLRVGMAAGGSFGPFGGAMSDYWQSTNVGRGSVGLGSNVLVIAEWASVGGGWKNLIGTNSRSATIGGGETNIISSNSFWAGIASGRSNYIGAGALDAFIGGGERNVVDADSLHSVIAGGWNNDISGTTFGCDFAAIGGGQQNSIVLSDNGTIAGGAANDIGANSTSAFIGGGGNNNIGGSGASTYSVIGGGQANIAQRGSFQFVGGGEKNQAGNSGADTDHNTVVAGVSNKISFSSGTTTDFSFVGGGAINTILNTSDHSTISGGLQNAIDAAQYGFIGGGRANVVTSAVGGTTVGGQGNQCDSGINGFVGGGTTNINQGDWAMIVGGKNNTIGTSGDMGFIVGSSNNVNALAAGAIGTRGTNLQAFSIVLAPAGSNSQSHFTASNTLIRTSFATVPDAIVTLTADNQVVDATLRTHIRLASDSGVANQRTFVLTGTNVTQGAHAILEWTGTNAGELVDDAANSGAGNIRLSATWTPTQYDTLSLIFNGTDWIERGRSAN